MSAAGFAVRGTKKGALPLSLEKRKNGKVITRIGNVSGDAAALLSALKAALGTGGAVASGDAAPGAHPGTCALELQGDQQKKLAAWLHRSGCLSGVRAVEEKATGKKPKGKPSAPATTPAAAPAAAPAAVRSRDERSKPRWAERASSSTSATAPVRSSSAPPLSPPDDFARFDALMRRWPYWDHDYSR